MSRPIRIAILTVSDRCSQGLAEDTSGPALQELVIEKLDAAIAATNCVPDSVDEIQTFVRDMTKPGQQIDLVLTTGGTGLGPRDLTPEAVSPLFDRPAPNLMELARARTGSQTPRAYLSRGVAGMIGSTLVLTLPGSEKGATQTLEALLDILPHAIDTIRGEPKDHAH